MVFAVQMGPISWGYPRSDGRSCLARKLIDIYIADRPIAICIELSVFGLQPLGNFTPVHVPGTSKSLYRDNLYLKSLSVNLRHPPPGPAGPPSHRDRIVSHKLTPPQHPYAICRSLLPRRYAPPPQL